MFNENEKDAFVHFCMEATNFYHELLAFSLLENKNYKVSVVNPRIVKSYAKSLVKTKNDKTDAKILAEFCKERNPRPFSPQSKERRELRDLSRLMDNLVDCIFECSSNIGISESLCIKSETLCKIEPSFPPGCL